jgi:hypothetical protein
MIQCLKAEGPLVRVASVKAFEEPVWGLKQGQLTCRWMLERLAEDHLQGVVLGRGL